MRTVTEWIGAHDDQAIPQRVKIRVLKRQLDHAKWLEEWARRGGMKRMAPTCPICTKGMYPGDGIDFDHIVPLADGGEHRESNIRAIHRRCHKLKTAKEAVSRAKHRKKVAHHYGIKKPRSRLSHPTLKRRMDGTVVRRDGRPV